MTYSRVLLVLVSLFVSTVTQAKEWHGLVPLHSTRTDVERVLGKPNAKYGRYAIKNEEATIIYSTGRCVEGWNVPPDIVISISVTFKQNRRLNDLNIDLRKYVSTNDPVVSSHVYYTNRSEGLRFVVFEGQGSDDGMILNVYYESTTEDEKVLRCPSFSGRQGLNLNVREACNPRKSRKGFAKPLRRKV